MDPVSLVVTAVALGASAGLKDTASEVVKDAYSALKALLTRRAVDVSALERKPDSEAQRAALQETLEDLAGTPNSVDEELLAAAGAATRAVADHDNDVARVVGVDLEDVQAEFIRIGAVQSTGDGVIARNIRTSGGVTIDSVRAGDPQQAADPSPR
jgi:hypothetical protein